MPEGPANGRVEAKRRALTMSSTAPASSARWWQGSIQVHDFILFPPKKRARSQTDCDARRQPTSSVASMHEQMHAGGAILLHGVGAETRTRDTTNDGVNDPVRAPWGQAPGTAPGSFTPWLVQ